MRDGSIAPAEVACGEEAAGREHRGGGSQAQFVSFAVERAERQCLVVAHGDHKKRHAVDVRFYEQREQRGAQREDEHDRVRGVLLFESSVDTEQDADDSERERELVHLRKSGYVVADYLAVFDTDREESQ